MLPFIALVSLAADPAPHVVATLRGADLARAGIVADVVATPPGIADADFAERLVALEGLRPWNGNAAIPASPPGEPIAYRSAWAGDGRNIVVHYAADSSARRAGRVCRIRARTSAVSSARYRAFRWCAGRFGVYLPARPPPPVVTIPADPN